MNFEEQHVERHNVINTIEEATLTSKSSLSLLERSLSKNPKERFNAISDIVKLFSNSESDSEIFTEYYEHFPRYLADSHSGAQEKAIEAFLILLNKSLITVNSTLGCCIESLIGKCITSGRTQIKAKAMECIMIIAELDAYELLQECLHNFLNTKTTPKVLVTTLQILTELLVNFGAKCFPVKDYAKTVAKLAGSTNSQVRTEALNYLKEGYKWDNASIVKNCAHLKQTQQEELKKEWNKSEEEDYLASVNEMTTKEEPFKDTLRSKQYKSQLCSQLMEAKKWNEKRDKLEELLKVIAGEGVERENLGELDTVLKVLLQDPNIVVSNLVLRTIGQLAKTFKRQYSTYAKRLFPSIVHKCRDKKSLIEAQKCLDNLISALKFEEMSEGIKEALEDKSPQVKTKVCRWLELTVFPQIEINTLKLLLTTIESSLIKLTEDAASEVRESALSCIEKTKQLITEVDQSGEVSNYITEDEAEGKFIGDEIELTPNKFEEGVTTEDATKLVFGCIPTDILALLDICNTKECQRGLQKLNGWVKENQAMAQELLESIIVWLKRKLKGFDEEVSKEFILLLETITNECAVNKRFVNEALPFLLGQFNDSDAFNVILLMADSVTMNCIIDLSIKIGYSDTKLAKPVLMFLIKLHESNRINSIKSTLDYANHCMTHKDLERLAKQYIEKVSREEVKAPELKSIAKASTRPTNTRSNSMTHLSVSNQVIAKILEGLKHHAMKKRQEAKDTLERMIANKNNKVQPDKISSIIIALKERMNEPCKNLAKAFITLVGNFALYLEQDFTKYSKIILQPLMSTLGDKQSAIRSETLISLDKISRAVGPEHIINNIGPLIIKDNPDIRASLLTWALNNKKALGTSDVQSLVRPLISVMQDRSKSIRNLGEQLAKEVINYVGYSVFKTVISDMKPAVKAGLENILSKYNTSLEDDNVNYEEVQEVKESKKAMNSRAEEESKQSVKEMKSPKFLRTVRQVTKAKLTASSKPPIAHSKRNNSEFLSQKHKIKDNSNTSSSSKQYEEEDDRLIIKQLENKEMRINYEDKWSIHEISEEHIIHLQNTLKNLLNPQIYKLLFSTDCKDNIMGAIKLTERVKYELNVLIDIADLIFKWITMKMIGQSNNGLIRSLLNFVREFFIAIKEEKYTMQDFEADCILPILCERLGNENLRANILELVELACKVYDHKKITSLILTTLESTMNQRTKSECLKLLTRLTMKYGPMYSSKNIKGIIKFIGLPLRNEALELLEEIYRSYGESIWKMIDNINESTKEILRKRFSCIKAHEEEIPIREEKVKFNLIKLKEVPIMTTQSPSNKVCFEQSEEPEEPEELRSDITPFDKMKDRKLRDYAQLTRNRSKENIYKVSEESINEPCEDDCDNSYETNEEQTVKDSEVDVSAYKDQEETSNNTSQAYDTSYEPQDSELNVEYRCKDTSSIEQTLNTLMTGNVSMMVEALMNLNEMATSINKESLAIHCDQLISTFTKVLKYIFDRPITEIPIRFAKYFITVAEKVCADKGIVRSASEGCLYWFMEKLLSKLLCDELYKVGENKEGEYIINTLNKVMLRLLENCNPTNNLIALIRLLKDYKKEKLTNLITKCILKLNRIMSNLITSINVPELLICLHKSLIGSSESSESFRMAKILVTELSKVKGKKLWEDYKNSGIHDSHIKHWINIDENPQINKIIKKLMEKETFNKGIKELSKYIETHEDVNIKECLSVYPKVFREKVLNSLKQYKDRDILSMKENDELETRLEYVRQKYRLKGIENNDKRKTTWYYRTVNN